MRKYIIYIILFLSAVSCAFAETSIKAEVDKKSLTTDEVLTYKLIIDSSERTVPLPQPPSFAGFNIVSQVNSTSFNLSAGGFKNAFAYIFMLAPLKTGQLEISPSTIKINDKTYSTDAFKIEVTQGKSKPKPDQKKILPQGASPSSEQTTL